MTRILTRRGVPVVLLARSLSNGEIASVCSDAVSVAHRLARGGRFNDETPRSAGLQEVPLRGFEPRFPP
jgi:hypothetical protein